MKALPAYPSLYQINTRVWLTELSRALGRAATLDDIPDAELDRVAGMGFDWVWFLSVWRTGAAAQRISRSNPEWRREFEETLPDLREEDIAGSGFAITGYTVHPGLGGDAALARLRERLRKRGLRLLLDFVPNHTAPDHPWAEDHPEYYVAGTERDLAQAPQNYTRVKRKGGDLILAYGRDPYFAGWPDTLQLDYSNPATQEAMIGELLRIAGQCDGVRCDMAMLVLPDVFERTWGRRAPLFWPEATRRVRERVPGFRFMAEVYWDLEWTMLQQGFDYAYDKRLYDRLREGHARPVREHLYAGLDYQSEARPVPGEPRRAQGGGDLRARGARGRGRHHVPVARACGSSTRGSSRGGGSASRRTWSARRWSPSTRRCSGSTTASWRCSGSRPFATASGACSSACRPGTATGRRTASSPGPGKRQDGQRRLIAVNYAGNQGQCYVRLPFPDLAGRAVRLKDLMGPASYDRDGSDLVSRGLYLDVPPWSYHVFEVIAV